MGDLDNVLYEISNESHANSVQWQYDMINYIKIYEVTKPKQHLGRHDRDVVPDSPQRLQYCRSSIVPQTGFRH